MSLPIPDDLGDYLGQSFTGQDYQRAMRTILVVASHVYSYTRGNGFTQPSAPWPNDELGAVILSAAARMVVNPTGVAREEMGGFVVQHSAPGFTMAELFVLNRFRERAM